MLALFHTAESNIAAFAALADALASQVPVRHIVRADLLDRAREAGSMTAELTAEATAAIEQSIQAEDVVMLCTCSTLGEAADQARHPRVPILRVDRPMAQAAVAAGSRILIAACLASTLEPTRELVMAEGATAPPEMMLIEGAWAHWQQGDRTSYQKAIAAALEPRLAGFDAVILAQASMAGAAELLHASPIPILSSPESGLRAALARLTA